MFYECVSLVIMADRLNTLQLLTMDGVDSSEREGECEDEDSDNDEE